MPPSSLRLLKERSLTRAAAAIRSDRMESLELGDLARIDSAPRPLVCAEEPLYMKGDRLDLTESDLNGGSRAGLTPAPNEFRGRLEATCRDPRTNLEFQTDRDKVYWDSVVDDRAHDGGPRWFSIAS